MTILLLIAILAACLVMYFAETECARLAACRVAVACCAIIAVFAPVRHDPPALWWYDRIGNVVFAGLAYFGVAALYRPQRPYHKAWDWQDRDALAPVGWSDKSSWLAIRNVEPEAVVTALKMRNVDRASWQDGVCISAAPRWRAIGSSLFVTPAVDGWVFVHGWRLNQFIGRDVAPLRAFLEDLSMRLGAPVQWYANIRFTSAWGWARAENGALTRAVLHPDDGHAAETFGEMTAEERKIGSFVDSPHEDGEELTAPHLSTAELAGLWGMSPAALDKHREPTEKGWLGRVDALGPAVAKSASSHH